MEAITALGVFVGVFLAAVGLVMLVGMGIIFLFFKLYKKLGAKQ